MRRAAALSDALILGGGPAGAAAAILLVRGARRATVIERDRETGDALCGGFLSWRTLDALARLGIDRAELNPAAVTRVRLFAGGSEAEARLPRPAIGVSRHRLDALLLDRAAAAGAGIERGIAVRAVEDGIARLADGSTLTARAMLLATGKHELRGAPRADVEDDPALGLRVRLPASPALDRLVGDAIELHLFDRGYAGLVRHEDGSANLCLAVRRSRLRAAGDPAALIAEVAREGPHLGERLARIDAMPPADAIANVPYGWRARATAPGLYRLGDQAAVIPSLAGEGMGIAIASGARAARAILSGIGAAQFQAEFAADAARPLAIAGAIRAAAETPAGARALVAAARLPGLARTVAALTRIKH